MSTTVFINSDGWTLTTFYGGELGRCYELTFPGHNTSHIVTEDQLLDFFATQGVLNNPRPLPDPPFIIETPEPTATEEQTWTTSSAVNATAPLPSSSETS